MGVAENNPDRLRERIVSLRLEVERLRGALEAIARRGSPFDTKGTHSKRVLDIALAALAPAPEGGSGA